MTIFKEIWQRLSASKGYRKEFVASMLKRGTAMQIQALLEQRGWTQAQLAEKSGLTQGVISRAQNPAYGNLTFNTVIEIAAGFDVAFIGKFVPFGEFARWVERMPQGISFKIPSFENENEARREVSSSDQVGMMPQLGFHNEQKATGKKVRVRRGKKTKRRAVSSLSRGSERTYNRTRFQAILSPAA